MALRTHARQPGVFCHEVVGHPLALGRRRCVKLDATIGSVALAIVAVALAGGDGGRVWLGGVDADGLAGFDDFLGVSSL
jgi:hypothetical protein